MLGVASPMVFWDLAAPGAPGQCAGRAWDCISTPKAAPSPTLPTLHVLVGRTWVLHLLKLSAVPKQGAALP